MTDKDRLNRAVNLLREMRRYFLDYRYAGAMDNEMRLKHKCSYLRALLAKAQEIVQEHEKK